jgi:hypothetical protein
MSTETVRLNGSKNMGGTLDKLEEMAPDYFPHTIDLRVLCSDYSNDISTEFENAIRFCQDHFGEDGIYIEYGPETSMVLDPQRLWTFVNHTIHFRDLDDLVAFQLGAL